MTDTRTIPEIRDERAALRDKRSRLADELDRLAAKPEAEFDAGDDERFQNLERGIKKVDREIEALRDEEVDAIARAAKVPGALESTTDETLQILRRVDAWGEKTDLRSSALKALERAQIPDSVDADATRERAAAILDEREEPHRTGSPVFAEWLVAGTNPAYVRAFDKFVRDPHTGPVLWTDEERAAVHAVKAWEARAAMAEGTTTLGGFMVPSMLDPALVLTNDGVVNPIRRTATVKTIATKTYTGVTSAGVTAAWRAEGTETSDASPTVGTISISPVAWDAWLVASFELVMDSDLASDITMLIADARDRLEGAGFTTGTGSTQPNGVITAVSAVTASRVAGSSGAAGAADFVIADTYALDNALPARHRPNSSWQGHISTLNKIRRFGESINSNSGFWADLGAGVPPTLLGHSIYENSAMDSTIVSGSNDDVLILGDFKKYFIVDRVGTSLVFEQLVKGASQRPTGQVGWYAFGRTGGDCADVNAFRLLRL